MSGAIIVGYHRVSERPRQDMLDRGLEVAAARFTEHLEILSRRFAIVPLDDLVDALAQGGDPGAKAAVTFDDGYEDNYTCAFPIVARMAVPATVFLSTDNIEQASPFWTDRLASWLCRSAGAVMPVPDALGGAVDLTSAPRLRQAYERLRVALSGLDAKRRLSVLNSLGAEEATESVPMTWNQVHVMARAGITFGAHTRSHPSLPALSDDAVRDEVESSRDIIAGRVGTPSRTFAYPFGDADDRVARIVEAAGFRGAVTVRWGMCLPDTSPLLLPRLMAGDWSGHVFERSVAAIRLGALASRPRGRTTHHVRRPGEARR